MALYDQTQIKRGTEAQELYQAACEKYSAALALAPNKPDVINDWGAALMEQAGLAAGDASAALYRQAQEKFLAAEAVRPGIACYISEDGERKEGELGLWYRSMIP